MLFSSKKTRLRNAQNELLKAYGFSSVPGSDELDDAHRCSFLASVMLDELCLKHYEKRAYECRLPDLIRVTAVGYLMCDAWATVLGRKAEPALMLLICLFGSRITGDDKAAAEVMVKVLLSGAIHVSTQLIENDLAAVSAFGNHVIRVATSGGRESDSIDAVDWGFQRFVVEPTSR